MINFAKTWLQIWILQRSYMSSSLKHGRERSVRKVQALTSEIEINESCVCFYFGGVSQLINLPWKSFGVLKTQVQDKTCKRV